jgi:hypothetical protein
LINQKKGKEEMVTKSRNQREGFYSEHYREKRVSRKDPKIKAKHVRSKDPNRKVSNVKGRREYRLNVSMSNAFNSMVAKPRNSFMDTFFPLTSKDKK